MKIWCISDTHGFHDDLIVPDNVDMVIHAGDASNERMSSPNLKEMFSFWTWFLGLNIKYKLFSPGNHDTSVERKLFLPSPEYFLEHESRVINDIKFFASPYTPSFGSGWSYNKDRSKLDQIWYTIPHDTDVLITHGPPKYILDLSHDRDGKLEYCGDLALYNHVNRVKPKYHIFGHIHNSKGCINQGTREINNTIFVNASCVEDGRFDRGATSNGVIIDI